MSEHVDWTKWNPSFIDEDMRRPQLIQLREYIANLEAEHAALKREAKRAFDVLAKIPQIPAPMWEDERDIDNRIQDAHDILDSVLKRGKP